MPYFVPPLTPALFVTNVIIVVLESSSSIDVIAMQKRTRRGWIDQLVWHGAQRRGSCPSAVDRRASAISKTQNAFLRWQSHTHYRKKTLCGQRPSKYVEIHCFEIWKRTKSRGTRYAALQINPATNVCDKVPKSIDAGRRAKFVLYRHEGQAPPPQISEITRDGLEVLWSRYDFFCFLGNPTTDKYRKTVKIKKGQWTTDDLRKSKINWVVMVPKWNPRTRITNTRRWW